MNKHNTTPIHKIRKIALSALLISSLTLSFASTTWAAASKIYEYDINGRLSTTYTTTEKTTFTYDANGNLLRKQVEKGDYSSKVNPQAPVVTPEPTPTPVPQPEPPPTLPIPGIDPSIVPPPVPVPAKSGLPSKLILDSPQLSLTSKTLDLYGWYLDPEGIAKAEVYVDDVYYGRANMGGSREDVYQAFPEYNNHVAGYYINQLKVTTLGSQYRKENNKGKKVDVPGAFIHSFKVVITNSKGIVKEISRGIVITTPVN